MPEFFDAMYRNANRDAAAIPWASLAPSPIVDAWLGKDDRRPGAAAVVASGLGDDAEALAAIGWYVTAFDISPTAIDWARERFPDSDVNYTVADLFDLPPEWSQAFSLVVEVFTIQSITPQARVRVIRAIADLVAPGGTLLVSAVVNRGEPVRSGPPWPLVEGDFRSFPMSGLEEVEREVRPSTWEGIDHVDTVYRRPELEGSIVR